MINKVLYTLDQRTAVTTAQQQCARDNIGAFAASGSSLLEPKITYNYSGTTITGLNGSAVGSTAAGFSGVSATTATLSGDGTSGSPLGLRDGWVLSGAGYTRVQSDAFTASSTAGPSMYGHLSAGVLYFGDSASTSNQIAMQWKNGNAVQMTMDGDYGGSAASSLLAPHRLELSIANNDQRVRLMPDYMRMTGTGSTSDIRPFGVYVEEEGGNSAKFEVAAIGMFDATINDRQNLMQPGRWDWQQGDTAGNLGNTVYWDNDAGALHLDGGLTSNSNIAIQYGSGIMTQIGVFGNGETIIRDNQVLNRDKTSNNTNTNLDSKSLTFRSATGTGDLDFVTVSVNYNFFTSLSAWATTQGWTGA